MTTTTTPAWKQFAWLGVFVAATVVGVYNARPDSKEPEQAKAAAPAPVPKLTEEQKEIARIQEEARKADQQASAWQRVLFSDHLDEFLVSAGIRQVSTEERIGMADHTEKLMKQTGEDCSTSPATVANIMAHKFPGSDHGALRRWVIEICNYQRVYGD